MSRMGNFGDINFVPLRTASCSVDQECGAEGAPGCRNHRVTHATLTHAPDRAFKRARQATQDCFLLFPC